MILRAPRAADARAVFDMLVARDLTDYGVADIALADLHDQWTAKGFDLEADAVLACSPGGRVVGYSAIHRPGAMGFVAPGHEGQGIGARLVAWAEQRERALGRERHGQAAASSNARARELFTARNYVYERSYARLVRAISGSETAPAAAGLELRPLAPERDARAVHALNERSFAGNPDYKPESLDEFVSEHLRAHDQAPELSLVAHAGGTLVGFLLARRWDAEAVGFIDLLAVDPQAQRLGIGSTLLRAAFARFAAAGLREAQLGVASDNPRAAQLYERAGMTPRFVVDTYHRPVEPASAAP